MAAQSKNHKIAGDISKLDKIEDGERCSLAKKASVLIPGIKRRECEGNPRLSKFLGKKLVEWIPRKSQ